jgi:hypothetical protein
MIQRPGDRSGHRERNFIERTFGETRRRTKVIGRLPGETSCLTLVWAVLDRASPGEVAEAESTRSPGWPGNGARLQRPLASRQADGLRSAVLDEVDSNAQAPWRLVAVTAVKLGKLVPRTVLTIFHEAATEPAGDVT